MIQSPTDSSSARRLVTVAPVPNPTIIAAASEQAENDQDQIRETWSALATRHAKQMLSTWMASLLLHFLLLGVLALVTLRSSGVDLGFELAFSDSVEAVDFDAVEFSLPAATMDAPDLESDALTEAETQLEDTQLTLDEAVTEPVELESMFAMADAMDFETGATMDEAFGDSEGQAGGTTGGVGSDGGASFYGINAEGSRFVYVIDASTSMLDDDRWHRAVIQLLESISGLRSSQRFLVMTYSSTFRPMMNMPLDDIQLVRATRANKKRLAAWLAGQRPNGFTQPAGAMMVGLSLNVDAIYLLSDGLLMDDTRQQLRVQNKPRILRFGGGKKTPVNTIAMDIVGDGADLLRDIAEENAGVFRVVR
jgi:hypothetical protein